MDNNESIEVLFCDPAHFDLIDVKNPFMKAGAALDRELARRQWEAVREAYQAAGCKVGTLAPVAGLEDMVFANNQVFVGRTKSGERFIVPSRMRYESRRREVPHYVELFRERSYRVIDIDFGDDFMEGHGDLLWQGNDFRSGKVWAGFGFRTTRGAIEKMQRALEPLGVELIPLQLRDPRFYHLDTCFAPLTEKAVLVYPEAFTPQAYATIQENAERVYVIGEQDALRFLCNGVSVNGRFITPAMSPQLKNALTRERLEPVVVDTSEFQKSGGSVCCLKLFL